MKNKSQKWLRVIFTFSGSEFFALSLKTERESEREKEKDAKRIRGSYVFICHHTNVPELMHEI